MEIYWSILVVPAFATLFVVIDPIGLVPMFLSLTDGMDALAAHQCDPGDLPRLLGMILAALAVQFVLTGLKDAGMVG